MHNTEENGEYEEFTVSHTIATPNSHFLWLVSKTKTMSPGPLLKQSKSNAKLQMALSMYVSEQSSACT
jgi:hypothetical protein